MKSQLLVGVIGWWLGSAQLSAAPVISSFTPAFGAYGDPGYINISGSGFSPGTLVVQFNGVTAPASATSGTLIQAQVPAGAPLGAGPIYVSVNGQPTYSAQDFTVIGPGPYITDFSPTIGGSGAPVTINGAHFYAPFTVRFNGIAAPGASAPTPTQISVTAPVGVTTGPVSVERVGWGTNTTTALFYVPPVLTGFSPTNGRPGTNVLITGTNFLGASAVRFNNVDATSFNVLSNNAIQAVVPTNATTGLIRVITPAGSAFSASNFVVRPLLTGFSPTFGNTGTNVTLSGQNLWGTTDVKFNGTTASFSGVTYGQLTATVPAGATTGPISVTTTNGSYTNLNNFYLPANITSFTPNNSAPGTTVKITGVNFTDATDVDFNGKAASFTVTNNTTIGAIVPNGVLTGPISVTTPAGTTNSSGLFYGVPGITGFNPSHGLPGTNVLLSGTNFLGATAVRFGTNTASFTVTNNTTIGATVPANAITGPITVIAPGGTNTTGTTFFLDYTVNLSVDVFDSPDPVTVGSNVVYTITIFNNGPYPAPGVVLTNTLPGLTLLVAATTSQGTLNTNANPITGSFGPVGLFGNVVVTLKVVPLAVGSITNIAFVASDYPDPLPGNNTAATATLVQSLPRLAIRLTDTNRIRVSWPADLTNYSLQYKPLLATTNYWSNDLTLPQTVGNERFVSETNLGSMKYYRLTK